MERRHDDRRRGRGRRRIDTTARRAADHRGLLAHALIWWRRLGRDVLTCVALGLAWWSLHVNDQESAKRRDQQCRIDETKEAADIETLRQTYLFLERQSPQQMAEKGGIAQAVLLNLPKTERDARQPDAAAYCNAPGIGLPEPGPTIPRRPRDLQPAVANARP